MSDLGVNSNIAVVKEVLLDQAVEVPTSDLVVEAAMNGLEIDSDRI